jgi:hypothetical protein
VADAIAQELVDAMMRDVRASVPEAEALPTERLRAYYQEHERRWVIPERRRVSLLTYASADVARAAFQRLGANPSDEAWRDAAKRGGCDDEACDRGHVGPMDDADGGNDRVPDPARAQVFIIEQLGGAALVVNGTQAWVVRYTGRTAAQAKSFEQAEQSVRNMLHQQLIEAERDALIARLREQLGFAIHADGVDLLELPAGFDDYVPYWQKKAP